MFELRCACQKDIELLIKYKLSTIYEYALEIDKDEKNRIHEYVKQSILQSFMKYKVILIDGKIVGCLYVTDYEDGVLIDEIYLEKEYRNQGIGSTLLREITNKHDVVYLWTYKENREAIKLYNRFYFKIVYETETRYFMKYVN